jgi:hypothetical protein
MATPTKTAPTATIAQVRDPRSIASVTPKRMSAHEQHPDGNEVRESQRQCRIVDENERNHDREEAFTH